MTNNKQLTAVEWLEQEMLKPNLSMKEILEQAKEMEKEQSQAYAAFCVACDRKKLPLLEFEGWIKLEGGNK
jgi:uncharacterized membrane protein YebE (DUF533 family)